MELDFALLADGVSPRPDGKIDIFGAGVDTVFTASVPARHTRLALMLRFALLEDADFERNHSMAVVLRSSDGQELARAGGEFGADEEARARRTVTDWITVNVVLYFDNVVFPAYGRYGHQMRRRGISEQEVDAVLAAPEITYPSTEQGRTVQVRTIGNRRIAVVTTDADPEVVITAFNQLDEI
jgi:hypothetical protein